MPQSEGSDWSPVSPVDGPSNDHGQGAGDGTFQPHAGQSSSGKGKHRTPHVDQHLPESSYKPRRQRHEDPSDSTDTEVLPDRFDAQGNKIPMVPQVSDRVYHRVGHARDVMEGMIGSDSPIGRMFGSTDKGKGHRGSK